MNANRSAIAHWTLATMVVLLVAVQGCAYVSRTARPRLTGYVYDAATKLPIEGCRVGETQTDATGYFELEERRYREVALVGMEAPPLLVRETVSKAGYEVFVIEGFNPYGGGSSKGTHWKIDPIYLQRAEMQ